MGHEIPKFLDGRVNQEVWNAAMEDGKVDESELNALKSGLSADEQASLTAYLQGKGLVDEDLSSKLLRERWDEVNAKKQELSDKAWEALKDGNLGLAAKLAKESIETDKTRESGAPHGVLAKMLLGALLGFIATSCVDGDNYELKQGDVYNDTNIVVNIIDESKKWMQPLLQEILAEIRNGNIQNKEFHNKMLSQGEATLIALAKLGGTVDDIKALLEKYDIKIDKLLEMMVKTNAIDAKILEAVTNGFADLKALLIDNNGKQTEFLNKLLEAIKEVNDSTGKNGEVLNKFFDYVKSIKIPEGLSSDDKAKFENLLESILTQIKNVLEVTQNGNEQDKVNYGNFRDFLSKILDAISKNTDMTKEGIEKAEKFYNEAVNFFNEVLAKLGDLKASGDARDAKLAAFMEKLLAAISKNTNITAEGFAAIKERLDVCISLGEKILDKIPTGTGSGNADMDKVLEVLNKIALNQQVNADDLKAFLTQAFNSAKEFAKGATQDILAKLDEILNKIPTCNCKCDPAEIVAKLEIIITKLEKGGNNNEGILGDLDGLEDLLG